METLSIALSVEAEPLEKYSNSFTRLVVEFVKAATAAEASFLTMGRIRYEIEQQLPPGGEIHVILREAGASKSSVSNAKYGAAAYRLVAAGKLSEAQFYKLSFGDCRFLDRLRIYHQPVTEILRVRQRYDLKDEVAVKLATLDCAEDLERWANEAATHQLSPITLMAGISRGSVISREKVHQKRGTNSGVSNLPAFVERLVNYTKTLGGLEFVASMSVSDARMLVTFCRPLREFLIAVEKRAKGG